LASINALSLVPKEAWLVCPKLHQTIDDVKVNSVSQRLDFISKPQQQDAIVYELKDLQKQYYLISARLELIQKQQSSLISEKAQKSALSLLTLNELFPLLVQHNLFETALSLAKLYDFQSIDLSLLFDHLTKKFITLLREETGKSVIEVDGYTVSIVWSLLKQYLQIYDSPNTNYQYHATVIEQIFSTERRVELPVWLTDSLKQKNAAALLRLYIKYNYFIEASSLVLDLLNSAIRNPGKKAMSSWLPLTLIQQLLICLDATLNDNFMIGEYVDKLKHLKDEIVKSLDELYSQLKINNLSIAQ